MQSAFEDREPLPAIGAALEAAGYAAGGADLDGRTVLVARASKFRWSWMATRLHTFVIVARFDPTPADREPLDRFAALASRYAIAHKGGLPRGLQTGTAAVAVCVVDRATEAVTGWAARTHGRRFASILYPVAVESLTGRVLHPRRMILGGIYGPHLRSVAEEILAPAATQAAAR